MNIELPSLTQYKYYLKNIFNSGRITNNGPFVKELELKISEYLDVPYIVVTSSGTMALQIAFKVFNLCNDIIISPFTWVTTLSSLLWIGLNPRFADIDYDTFNIDPDKIEGAIKKWIFRTYRI